MKRICLIAIMGAFLFPSCSESSDVTSPAEGSIVLSTRKNIDTEKKEISTRAAEELTDLTGYFLTLNDEAVEIPANGRIDHLAPDTYLVGLSNLESEEDYTPAFDAPKYSGFTTVNVAAGEAVRANVELTQANAGVYFVYDASLEELGLQDVVPIITAGDDTLDYSDNREATGYFMPGDLMVSFTHNDDPIDIDGENERAIRVKAAQLWKITLKGSLSPVVSLVMEKELK